MRSVLFFLLGTTYIAGEILQVSAIGPDWLRWHLSDFGFVLSVAWSLMTLFGIKPKYGLAIAYIFANAYEGWQFYNQSGDIIDVILFALALLIGLWLTRKDNKTRDK